MLLNNKWVKDEIKEEIKNFWKQIKMNSQQSKTLEQSKGSPEREIHSNTGLPKKERNISIKQPNPISTRTEEQHQRQPRESRRKEITKIRAELMT